MFIENFEGELTLQFDEITQIIRQDDAPIESLILEDRDSELARLQDSHKEVLEKSALIEKEEALLTEDIKTDKEILRQMKMDQDPSFIQNFQRRITQILEERINSDQKVL